MSMKNRKKPSSDSVKADYLRKRTSKQQELHDSGSGFFYAPSAALENNAGRRKKASHESSSEEIKAHLDYLKKEIFEMTFALKFFDAFLEKKFK